MKQFINNRKGQKIVVVVEEKENPKGLSFVMHGLGGYKEQPHIRSMIEAFLEGGYTVVSFDTTNTMGKGESYSNYPDATITNYYEDLEDVIEWTSKQSFYQEPFCLSGHSLGGICVALFAENFPEKVKALAPISTVISGQLSMDSHSKEEMDNWKEIGMLIKKSNSQLGVIKKLKWSHMEDRLKYDLLEKVDKITMPVLMIVGTEDTSTPPKHQKILFEAIKSEKEFHLIENCPHTFKEPEHINQVKQLFKNWIKKI